MKKSFRYVAFIVAKFEMQVKRCALFVKKLLQLYINYANIKSQKTYEKRYEQWMKAIL